VIPVSDAPGLEEVVMKAKPVMASVQARGRTMSAEFHPDTGRLRILDGGALVAEMFPPHSWFAIASVAGKSRWGTRPNEADLYLVIANYAMRRTGLSGYTGDDPGDTFAGSEPTAV
jgi:hypothetical protein